MESDDSAPLVRLAGLNVTAGNSAVTGSLILWAALGLAGIYLLDFSLPKALVLAVGAVAVHWISVLLHQGGHAIAARSTGYPMIGIHLWGLLSSSRYPPDEPPLTAQVHVRRALGGPLFSLVIAVAAGMLLLLFTQGTWGWWLALFFCLDNLLVFTIGSLLPLGFTDGSTLLRVGRARD
jgi:hypothetical protein